MHRFDSARRLNLAAFVLSIAGVLSTSAPGPARADDDEQDSEKQAAQERKERYLSWMRTYAQETRITLGNQVEGEANAEPAKLVPNPVFRYSDEQRFIPDATLWVWTRDARPVAFQKVEGNNHGGGQAWTICFASLSEGLLKARWQVAPNTARDYAAKKPGVTFSPIPRTDPPAASARARTSQLKVLKDRFTGRLNVSDDGKGGAETRTMAKPIFEYADPQTKLPIGAIFGMTSTGTNPDLLLLIEARADADGKLRWEYAHARMTSNSVRVRLDDVEVWSESFAPVNNAVFENWTFYFLPRTFK